MNDTTQGSIARESFLTTFYLWPNTIFWIAVHLLNLFWLSRIGIGAVVGAAIGSAAFILLMTPIRGIVVATYGMVGSFEKENSAGLERIIKQILSITLLVSVGLALAGYFSAPHILRLLGTEEEITSLAVIYFRIQALSGIIAFLFWPINEIYRNIGQMRRAMILMGIVLVLQGILDYLLISQMGVAGASLSRAVSGTAGASIGFWWLCRQKLINFNWQGFKISPAVFREIVRIAGFNTVQGFSRQAVQMVMLAVVASFGTLALGAYEIGNRFFRYCSMFGMDVGKTAALGCARNLGEGKAERAGKWVWFNAGAIVLLTGLMGMLLFVFADNVIRIFSQTPEVINFGSNYFKLTAFGYVFFAVGLVLERAFGAAKDTKTPMLAYFGMAGIQIGLALVLPGFFGLGINGVWLALLIGMIFYGLILTILFQIGRWKPTRDN